MLRKYGSRMFRNYRIRDYDFKLMAMILALASIGIMAIGSAEESLQKRQLAGVVAGAVAMIIISFFNYSMILKLYWPVMTPKERRDGWKSAV